jgi:U3 small nucleolar RNA-associated protein 22
MARPGTTVDVALEMPSACFDEKDQLNGRYTARRAHYLAHVAAAFRKKAAFKRLSWEFLQHDARWSMERNQACRKSSTCGEMCVQSLSLLHCRRPVLVIQPHAKGQEEPLGFTLRLIPTIAVGTFAAPKLAPGRNNLRPAAPGAVANGEAAEQPLPATPLYNNAILQVAVAAALLPVLPCLPRLLSKPTRLVPVLGWVWYKSPRKKG